MKEHAYTSRLFLENNVKAQLQMYHYYDQAVLIADQLNVKGYLIEYLSDCVVDTLKMRKKAPVTVEGVVPEDSSRPELQRPAALRRLDKGEKPERGGDVPGRKL